MPGEFVRWLDMIPGRNWLVAGWDDEALLEEITATKPSGVTTLADPSPLTSGTFDVAVTIQPEALLPELRRVVVPGGIVAAYGQDSRVDQLFVKAGLHAVQTRALAHGWAVKGMR
ncbi:MAG TPA: hypothetical protein VK457_07365 [Chloroflexota bacterium]|nr:hypothetical protein [Chloroflexota bacterium]